ncbi:succinate dehydrogenase, hydrophobic membrane anchor protein [Roseobacter denitrificans]|uniref:Succinate dehydrogenase hydrophobic membrane anchor subunit n=1 Tax=Roseobacter denitrificans (strain ATCC 33942 / OCh 114) TaxID=375451 RepID=Q169T9_ROSDO|nr:succinate dehydrogenase, hydrophobic membrane anchor protein [Roseobacter denitrificans]ABG31254.1 suc [Roseobacter denitrificans OCh 114]AVL54302.1 succinate dehydrogenase, hydrophobic membrane anchor protein [Roseobacter denitrificans]SFF98571.1 succinate dehydrogenase subunit D [Roseobacter denitrificans OCh 114]
MSYLTDRKRAVGLGSAKSGTEHHWSMTVSSGALLILIPLFVFTFGPMLGASYDEVTAYFARPFPAVIAGLTIIVTFKHFAGGVQALLEDYVHGVAQKVAIVAMTCVSYAAMGFGLYAVVRLAL